MSVIELREAMPERYRILIVEDEDEQAEMVQEYLRLSGPFDTERVANLTDFWERIVARPFDVVLIDYRLPDGTGLAALEKLRADGQELPVIMITGQGDERLAVQAMQAGATNYLIKGSEELVKLPSLLQKAVREHELELSIRRSTEQVRYQALLLNNVRDAVVVWNTAGRLTYCNPAAEILLGLNSKDIIGKPVEEHYLNLFNPPIRPPSREATAGMEIERQIAGVNGEPLWVSSRVSALRDYGANGRLIGYMDVCRDITQRKQTETALRLSRERYTLATAAAKVGVWDWDLKDGTFYIDPNLKDLLGYRDDELANKFRVWNSLIHPEDYPGAAAALRTHIEGQTSEYMAEYRMRHRDGSLRWIYAHGRRLVDPVGKVIRVVGTQTDISERKQMEAQIQAVQTRLTQAARLAAVGELASGVAHHINNPLTTIIAESQLMLQGLPSDHPLRESAEFIEQAGWRVQQAVQQLIDFVKPAPDTFEPLDLNETIHSAVALVGEQIRAAGINLEVALSPQLPHTSGNARQLGDLWVNLLMLARNAAGGELGHSIRIATQTGAPDEILVTIADDCAPIPAAEMETLFEPDLLQTLSGRGSGIELAICQEIVQHHNGQISAESSAERGTIFCISFPVEVET